VVVDLAGRRVRTLASCREFAPGLNRLEWDGRDSAGRPVPAGVYLMRVRAGGESAVQRVVVSR
jgi:flagellar hook assembly protein FlgD